jgi:hypothetical protein
VPITGEALGGVSVPVGAVAVFGNVTAVNAVSHGYLASWYDGATQPGTSSLNYQANTALADALTVALPAAGQMDTFASQSTDVIFDATVFIAWGGGEHLSSLAMPAGSSNDDRRHEYPSPSARHRRHQGVGHS